MYRDYLLDADDAEDILADVDPDGGRSVSARRGGSSWAASPVEGISPWLARQLEEAAGPSC